MLAITHLAAGATVGLTVRRPLPRTLAALVSHAVLDGIPHDDRRIGIRAQGALAGAAALAVVVAWGPVSPVVLGGITGAAPDAEIAADQLVFGGRLPGYAFPSHWRLPNRSKQHPYRFPGPSVPVEVELAVSVGAIAAICALGVRRRRGR